MQKMLEDLFGGLNNIVHFNFPIFPSWAKKRLGLLVEIACLKVLKLVSYKKFIGLLHMFQQELRLMNRSLRSL